MNFSPLIFYCLMGWASLTSQAQEPSPSSPSVILVEAAMTVQVVSVEQTQALLAGGTPPIVIDIRTSQEFKKSHLEGAKLIDYRGKSFRKEVAKLDRQQAYLIYCRSGVRSEKSLQIWEELGFQQLYHMKSGMRGWQQKNGKTVTGL